jgi:hypothetical protein
MPILCQTVGLAIIGPTHDSPILALRHIGPRLCRSIPNRFDGYKYILLAVDKFTKWIQVRLITKVTSEEVGKLMQEITHRFGMPNRIITDLGSAFTRSAFWNFC